MTAKIRPCLVISIPALDKDWALATELPHTTSSRGSRFEVDIETRFLRAGVFDAQKLDNHSTCQANAEAGNTHSRTARRDRRSYTIVAGFVERLIATPKGSNKALQRRPRSTVLIVPRLPLAAPLSRGVRPLEITKRVSLRGRSPI